MWYKALSCSNPHEKRSGYEENPFGSGLHGVPLSPGNGPGHGSQGGTIRPPGIDGDEGRYRHDHPDPVHREGHPGGELLETQRDHQRPRGGDLVRCPARYRPAEGLSQGYKGCVGRLAHHRRDDLDDLCRRRDRPCRPRASGSTGHGGGRPPARQTPVHTHIHCRRGRKGLRERHEDGL